jgi:hypothetical protein
MVPLQIPPWQVSTVVQASLSSHEVPFASPTQPPDPPVPLAVALALVDAVVTPPVPPVALEVEDATPPPAPPTLDVELPLELVVVGDPPPVADEVLPPPLPWGSGPGHPARARGTVEHRMRANRGIVDRIMNSPACNRHAGARGVNW